MTVSEEHKGIVKKAVVSAAGVGLPGIVAPTLDTAGVASVWTIMVGALAKKSGHNVDAKLIAKLITGALASVASYQLGSKILTWLAVPLILTFPVAGIPAVVGLNGVLNAIFTYRLGVFLSEQLTRSDFTTRDFIGLSQRIGAIFLGVPTPREIADVKELLLG
jgi:hypothetical protein